MNQQVIEMIEIPEVVALYGVEPPDKSIKGNIGIIATIITGIVAIGIGIVIFIKRRMKNKKGGNSNEEVKK